MLLKELMDKFHIKLNLNETLLKCNIKGEYTKAYTDKRTLKYLSEEGYIFKEFPCTILKGSNCECILSEDCNLENVKVIYTTNNGVIHSYSYNRIGNISNIS